MVEKTLPISMCPWNKGWSYQYVNYSIFYLPIQPTVPTSSNSFHSTKESLYNCFRSTKESLYNSFRSTKESLYNSFHSTKESL
jgi:hypothetical protein